MVEEEKILEEVHLKHQGVEMEVSIKSENLELSDSMFSKLDELLNQTEMYTKFLLEKMDDTTFVSYTNVLVISCFLILISWPFSECFYSCAQNAVADDNVQATQGTNVKISRKTKAVVVRNAVILTPLRHYLTFSLIKMY